MNHHNPFNHQTSSLSDNWKRQLFLEQSMTPEQLKEYKREAMKPFKTRNIIVSFGLFSMVGLIYGITMYKMRPDDFNTIKDLDKYKMKQQE